MSSVSVSHYLTGMAKSIKRQVRQVAAGQFPFVTISRESGAGGRTLARELVRQINAKGDAESGGWAVFDGAMCKSIVDHPRLGTMLEGLLEEHYRTSVQDFVHTLIGGAAQDVAYSKLAEVQLQVAALGKVVFVGSGASCVTRDLPLGVHVRLVASMHDRQNRISKLMDIDKPAAEKQIRLTDREREQLIKKHFATDTTDPGNYDVTWNTSRVPFEHVAKSVLALVRARQGRGQFT